MDYFSPGLRELGRIGRRALRRLQIMLAKRQLAHAETQLGLLGWQQADFDAETQRQVDAIHHVERAQAELTNRSAELARELQAAAEQRAEARREFEKERSLVEQDRSAAVKLTAEIDRSMAVLEARGPDLERQLAALDGEEKELDQLYQRLLAIQPQTAQVRDDIVRLRERLLALQAQRPELKLKQARLTEDLQARRQEQSAAKERLRQIEEQLRAKIAAADTRDAEAAVKIRELEKAKDQAVTGFDRLERAKLDPYREVGRVLADSGVAPMNQPEALERVTALRHSILEAEYDVALSRSATLSEDAQLLRISLGLLAVIAIAFVLILAALR